MGSKSKRLFVHGMTIVGLPDAAIQESRERVQASILQD
jgi:predicted ATPase with chaperone activity